LRNTFRYLLGALDGFGDAERLDDVAAYPELERYMLHLAAELDGKLRQAVADYDFNSYVRALTDFCNEDLSAFYFDIRKDRLYCDAPGNPKRRAYRTTLDILFHALVRWLAPVLVFTTEEVWDTRFPEADSVHLLEWPEIGDWMNPQLGLRYKELRMVRALAFSGLENARRDKDIGSSLEARISIELMNEGHALAAAQWSNEDWQEFLIVSEVEVTENIQRMVGTGIGASVGRTANHKCGRCWRHLPEVEDDGDLCARCAEVVG
jgi:isoleucyl-tRNA synthetase